MSAKSWLGLCWQLWLPNLLAVSELIASVDNDVLAQVTADPSVGTSVNSKGTTLEITGGTTVGGTNLFHSFSSFSVPSGETATFLNAPSITNILSRVTGSSLSDIQGTIRTQGSANLFLMNPNGIVFGPGAQLNVGGSFVATTASAIGFPGGGEFSITPPVNPHNPLLSVNPSAFLFNQIAAQPTHSIESQASLSVPAGRSLLLVGGNTSPTVSSTGSISIDGGTLLAPGGRVELGGVTGSGTVGLDFLDADGNSLGLSFPNNLARADISLRNATIDVAAGGGGSITLYARNLEISGHRNIGGITGDSLKPGDTYTLQVSTENHNLGSAGTVNETEPNNSVGTAQNIDEFLSLNSNPDVDSSTIPHTSISATGDGTFDYYSVTVQNPGSRGIFDIDNSAGGPNGIDTQIYLFDSQGNLLAGSDESSRARGAGGSTSTSDSYINYVFQSPGTYVIGVGGGSFATVPSTLRAGIRAGLGSIGAQAGDIKIDATGSVTVAEGDIVNTVEPGAIGNGGGINITAESLSMINGVRLFAHTRGQGNAGSINIATSGPVSFSGFDAEADYSSASSSVNSGAVGRGGNITIRAGSLSLDDGATLLTRTRGQGDAGSITIEASGPVSIAGRDSDGFSSFVSSSVDPGAVGKGGDITIRAGSFALDDGAFMIARTRGQGDAGNVMLDVRGPVSLAGVDVEGFSSLISTVNGVEFSSFIPSSVRNDDAVGRGGDITIRAGSLSLRDGARLATSTLKRGEAGNITIEVDDVVSFAGVDNFGGSSFASSSVQNGAVGRSGDITIRAGAISLSDGAQVSASTFGQGDAGNISVNVRDTLQADNSTISTTAEQFSGGAIQITASDIRLSGNSDIRTNVASGTGNGGEITLSANSIVAFNDSDILGFARDGRGGNITLDTPAFLGFRYQPAPPGTDPATLEGNDQVDINASSRLAAGTVTLPNINPLPNRLMEIPSEVIDTSTLIANSCIARSDRRGGSFIITGAGGLPTLPDDLADSPFQTFQVTPSSTARATNSDRSWQIGDRIVEADRLYRLANGQLLLGRACR